MLKYDFYRSWYLPSNGTIAIGVGAFRDLELHFQGQTFSCYADVPGRFASTHHHQPAHQPTWSPIRAHTHQSLARLRSTFTFSKFIFKGVF